MRNLKKFLALVMAMVMALSLMVSANAAWTPVTGTTGTQYNDVNDVTPAFEEAVDVLTGMKVYQGDAEAPTFRPGSSITRAEVAALIYRLATGDTGTEKMDLYTTMHPFTDVRADAWYAGYVGYCYNAGYIKGTTATTFNPSANVTGYEVLAMILRAVGYDKNDEFTGPTWQINVSSLSTQLGILNDVKSTHYGDTLHLASRRDVVASLLFRTAAYVPQVIYTAAFGYQQTGMGIGSQVGTPATTATNLNPSLGWQNFGLSWNDDGVVVGNQQTGQGATVMGYAGSVTLPQNTVTSDTITGTTQIPDPANPGQFITADVTYTVATNARGEQVISWNPYAFAGQVVAAAPVGTFNVGDNRNYELETGIDLFGHNLKLWFDGRAGRSNHVYAYYDLSTKTAVVEANNIDLAAGHTGAPDEVDLNEAASGAGFANVNSAVFSNSFSRFGSDFTAAVNVGNGTAAVNPTDIESPVELYLLIANGNLSGRSNNLDVVISLNVESSQITESNDVNRVPTLGMPIFNPVKGADNDDWRLNTEYIKDNENTKTVGGVLTGVIAQAALVGNSTKTLGDYEMGIHITGTTPRTISAAETQAINGTGAETARYLLAKVTATVEGTVVAYNNELGTVTLQDGTVLERSDFYKTVVGWTDSQARNLSAPNTAIPQGWIQGATNWEEGYANVGYKFYTDFEGKYLGAERSYGSTFLYGTYLDYTTQTNSSTFTYTMTGVNLNGAVDTKQVTNYWRTPVDRNSLNGTNQLGIPYRDANNTAGDGYAVNGLGFGMYTGFAFTGTVVDGLVNDPNSDRVEYLNNMRRLGVYQGAEVNPNGAAQLNGNTTINGTSTTLGAEEVLNSASTGTNRYFTEATKFILVSGFGTDTLKPVVFNGISELKGTSSAVILNLGKTMGPDGVGADILANGIYDRASGGAADVSKMTYYTESPYTYAQSGQTAMKVDTIILPAAAVEWVGGSGLYYVGDPNFSMINAWGLDAWKYTLYQDGEKREVWLTNDPNGVSALDNDVFVHLQATGINANDGQPIYRAGNYNAGGTFTFGTYLTNTLVSAATPGALLPASNGVNYLTEVTYSAVTRDAQTATFTGTDTNKLLRVAGAKVVNLNAANSPTPGHIWKNVGDNLGDVNAAGSIDPVTANKLKVSAIVDPSNPLVVTTIYVCWEQDQT